MKPIEPNCPHCAKLMIKVSSGLTCMEGPTRIRSAPEFEDAAVLPTKRHPGERMVQIPLSYRSLGAIYNFRLRVGGRH